MSEVNYRSDMKVELIDHMGSDETVARAARVSTGKDQIDQGKIEGLINYLVREGHTSTVEHCTVTLRVNVPVFVHRQIMTHRTLSKNSESGRYTELKPDFYIPDVHRPLVNAGSSAHPNLVHSTDPELWNRTTETHKVVYENAWAAYTTMIEDGVATEVARNVLPQGAYTSAYMTGNLLAWFNFLRLRLGVTGHPQDEITDVAEQALTILEELYPLTMSAWKKSIGIDI